MEPKSSNPAGKYPGLLKLARLYGVETHYRARSGQSVPRGPDVLTAVLQALGSSLKGPADAPDAVRNRLLDLWQDTVEPVVVHWQGRPLAVDLKLPEAWAHSRFRVEVHVEGGSLLIHEGHLDDVPVIAHSPLDLGRYVKKRLVWSPLLPPGYHPTHVAIGPHAADMLIISAYLRAYGPSESKRGLGLFVPAYALRSKTHGDGGTFGALEHLQDWAAQFAAFIGTLPLLPTFLDEPCDPSPYSAISRLFWNEWYVDVGETASNGPESEVHPVAGATAPSPPKSGRFICYRQEMQVKRQALAQKASSYFQRGNPQWLAKWVAEHPNVVDYARFRATVDTLHETWPAWPARLRAGHLKPGDYDPDAFRYHLFAQWQADLQMTRFSQRGRQTGWGPYLDFPLGVHPLGYDVWREREAFVPEVSTGAPPDMFLADGQNWGFWPLHPDGIRRQQYRYVIDSLRHHLRHAGILRLDHVMGLHRLYWIPPHISAKEGVYVRYRPEEFYAILSLESHRHQTVLVGEDLGQVPPLVRTAMKTHGVRRLFVVPYEWDRLGDVPPRALATLNTHDMPPFARMWSTLDPRVRDRVQAFLEMTAESGDAAIDAKTALVHLLRYLAASPADLLVVNLEDLWLEEEPQNVPGVLDPHNWRRKTARTLDDLTTDQEIRHCLEVVAQLRRFPSPSPDPHAWHKEVQRAWNNQSHWDRRT